MVEINGTNVGGDDLKLLRCGDFKYSSVPSEFHRVRP